MNSPLPAQTIKNQVQLPVSVAWGVVVQSIRIRLGRSMVTMTGVVLGVAFLMSILTANLIRSRVSDEIKIRQTLGAMMSFLEAETGPLKDREIVVFQGGALNPIELRFLERLKMGEVRKVLFVSETGEVAGEGNQVSALVVLGGENVPPSIWNRVFPLLRQKIAAFTRVAVTPPSGATLALLTREQTPEAAAKEISEEKRQNVRTIWIVTIAVLVTTISISNALLMSVTERFKEIGTMKCLGALSSFIRQVFFIESALLGLAGSLLGAAFGMLFSVVVYSFSFGWGMVFTSMPYALLVGAFMVCTIGGIAASIAAAIYPASFASKMVPATALRTSI